MNLADSSQLFGLIAVFSGLIGSGLYLKGKVVEVAKKLDEHLAADTQVHTSMTDRLARIETKIDMLVERSNL